VLPSLPKIVGFGLATGPNAVGFGCQAKPKTLPKRANNVRSCYPAGPNSVGSRLARPKILQTGTGSGCPARPTDFGSSCAAIPKDIIIYILNILNFIIINFKNITICIINIIFLL
jgi:hypothetical protein